MNPVYPSIAQVKHDAFYTMVSSAIASIMEILLCYGWANGQLAMETSLMNRYIYGEPTLLVLCLYKMLPLNCKRTTSSLASTIF